MLFEEFIVGYAALRILINRRKSIDSELSISSESLHFSFIRSFNILSFVTSLRKDRLLIAVQVEDFFIRDNSFSLLNRFNIRYLEFSFGFKIILFLELNILNLFSMIIRSDLRLFYLLLHFISFLLLSLDIILCQVAVLAHSTGVVGFVWVATSIRLLGLTFSMVAVVAHVLGIVLSICVRTFENFSSFSQALSFLSLLI